MHVQRSIQNSNFAFLDRRSLNSSSSHPLQLKISPIQSTSTTPSLLSSLVASASINVCEIFKVQPFNKNHSDGWYSPFPYKTCLLCFYAHSESHDRKCTPWHQTKFIQIPFPHISPARHETNSGTSPHFVEYWEPQRNLCSKQPTPTRSAKARNPHIEQGHNYRSPLFMHSQNIQHKLEKMGVHLFGVRFGRVHDWITTEIH